MQTFVPDGSLNLLIYVLPAEPFSGRSHWSNRPLQRGAAWPLSFIHVPGSSKRRCSARTRAQTLLIVLSIDKLVPVNYWFSTASWQSSGPSLGHLWGVTGEGNPGAASICPTNTHIFRHKPAERLIACITLTLLWAIQPELEKRLLDYHWNTAYLKRYSPSWMKNNHTVHVLLSHSTALKWISENFRSNGTPTWSNNFKIIS